MVSSSDFVVPKFVFLFDVGLVFVQGDGLAVSMGYVRNCKILAVLAGLRSRRIKLL